jgi:hypothetical protein
MESVDHPVKFYSSPTQHIIFLTYLDRFLTIITNKPSLSTPTPYLLPKKTSSPSFQDQVSADPMAIVDPYKLSLSHNYYYPLSFSIPIIEMENNYDPQTPLAPSQSPKSPTKKPIVTAEDSIETIMDLLEGDELAAQTQTETEAFHPATQVQPTYFNHRFAIYRKSSTPYVANTPSQLNLFKSFCKSLKSIDPQLQVLPMHNDHQIHPISTTDQINNVDEIGLLNFFKPYKRTKKTLSGDFHIGTKLTFNELKANTNFTMWLHMNGYNVMLNSCQTSDMVRIGFLNHVRTFTYRDDLKMHIMQSDQWKSD